MLEHFLERANHDLSNEVLDAESSIALIFFEALLEVMFE